MRILAHSALGRDWLCVGSASRSERVRLAWLFLQKSRSASRCVMSHATLTAVLTSSVETRNGPTEKFGNRFLTGFDCLSFANFHSPSRLRRDRFPKKFARTSSSLRPFGLRSGCLRQNCATVSTRSACVSHLRAKRKLYSLNTRAILPKARWNVHDLVCARHFSTPSAPSSLESLRHQSSH